MSPATTLNLCLTSGQYCNLVNRDRLGTLWLLDDGRVTATNQNLGGTKTSGLDLAFNYDGKFGNGYGGCNVNFIGTWLRELEIEEIAGTRQVRLRRPVRRQQVRHCPTPSGVTSCAARGSRRGTATSR